MKRLNQLIVALLVLFFFCGCEARSGKNADLIAMAMVNNELYLDTGIESTYERCGLMDGEITSSVASTEKPTKNDQSNFGRGYGYQYGAEGTIEILINDKWIIFATEEARQELFSKENNTYDGYVLVSELDNYDGVDTTILAKFNDVLFAKSFALIDYECKSEPVGTIDTLIPNKYVPFNNSETNQEELLNALVYDFSENSVILFYDNVFHLFERIDYLK